MNRRWTTKRVWRVLRFVLIGLGVGGLLAATTDWNWRNQLNRSAADLLVRSLAPQVPVPHIAIVGIDDASLNSTSGYGRLTEWDRTLYARLLVELERAGARVVVFDVLFTGHASAGDAAFAQALRDHPNTVLAVAQADDDHTLAQPIDQLQVGNAAIPATIAPAKPQPLSGGDARAAVIAALVAQVQGGPYRMTTVTESSGAPFEVVGEVVPPDRYHTTNVFDGITTEMIIIGDVIWRKVDDTWTESSFVEGAAGLASINSPETITAAVSDATLVGSDTLAGVPVIVYRYISTFGEGEFVVASDTTLWVDAASGLPLKIQSLSDIGGEKSTTTQTIVYDPSVTVKPPE